MSKKEKVLTFLKYSLRNRDIFVEKENNEMASGENPPYNNNNNNNNFIQKNTLKYNLYNLH